MIFLKTSDKFKDNIELNLNELNKIEPTSLELQEILDVFKYIGELVFLATKNFD